MPVPENIIKLVETFDRNHEAYTSGRYNETQVRREFVDPLFVELGWDINNTKGYAEAYKDVIHEDSIRIGGVLKAPDYCFRIGGTRKFFVEAKNPSINIKGDPNPAYQIRRYAWSSKLPLSILTDFEEFAVYDCRVRPLKNDKASKSRTTYIRYTEYIERWDEIESIFSRDAVLKGSFDKFAQSKKRKGTAEVDDAFLSEIEIWRETLAKNIALRNQNLTVRQLNFAVQKTIDRIIFLRIAEDRGIEQNRNLTNQINGNDVYQRLLQIFRKADDRYNSGLFHFTDEKDRPESPDVLTPSLIIDDKPLRDIIRSLYPPDCPYEFSVLPIEILGNIYEQFLGKVITLTSAHRAKIEEKPEVKKAGGIYYTPSYIVDYIVENTVGKLTENKTPTQVSKIKILDPACGSGSFLLGAYKYLLDWHLKYYSDNEPEKLLKAKNPRIAEIASVPPIKTTKSYKLTTAERKRILLNNIFGVDIDSQAVEVTKLSLLLKVLEGEKQLVLFHQERALPDLVNNIKCGNSLIASDFYKNQQLALFDDEQKYKINAFDWEKEFPKIFNKKFPGFDAVIGNPPYIQLSMASYYNKEVNNYISHKHSSSMGRLNTFGLFIDKMLQKTLAANGFLSFIVPNTILTQEYYTSLRLQLLQYRLSSITSYTSPVFVNAVVETVVFVTQKSKARNNVISIVECDNDQMIYHKKHLPQDIYFATHNNSFLVTVDNNSLALKLKIDGQGTILKSLANLNQAIALKSDRSKSLFTKPKADNYKPVLDGRNIQRYTLNWDNTYLAYDVNKIHSCKRTDIFEAPEKLFFRRVGACLVATYDNEQFYALNTLVVITFKESAGMDLKFLLGLINSSLLNFYYVKYLKSTKKVFSEIQARQLAQLPIHTISPSDLTDKSHHDKMVSLVESMLELNKKLAAVKTPDEKNMLQRQIDSIDDQIDELVYKLYDLTEEEIKIVKEASA